MKIPRLDFLSAKTLTREQLNRANRAVLNSVTDHVGRRAFTIIEENFGQMSKALQLAFKILLQKIINHLVDKVDIDKLFDSDYIAHVAMHIYNSIEDMGMYIDESILDELNEDQAFLYYVRSSIDYENVIPLIVESLDVDEEQISEQEQMERTNQYILDWVDKERRKRRKRD